jgi:hypothetical protein
MSLFTALDNVERVQFPVSGEILHKRGLLRLRGDVIGRLHRPPLLFRFVEHFVLEVQVVDVVVVPGFVLDGDVLIDDGDVPVVHLGGLSVALEVDGDGLARGAHGIGAVVGVVMGIGGQLDYVHVRVIGAGVVAGLDRQTLAVVGIGGFDARETQLREHLVLSTRGRRVGGGEDGRREQQSEHEIAETKTKNLRKQFFKLFSTVINSHFSPL